MMPPSAVFTPDPEPHTMSGLGNYDELGDLQRIESEVFRRTLDSLAQSITPATEVVQGAVNMQDLLHPKPGGIVRVTQPGAMREIKHSFVGGDTLPIMDFLTQIRENRTGTSKAAMGLDADALQSSTKAAVAGTLSAAQQRIEIIARNFAETGLKDLYRLVNRKVVQHQQPGRIVRIREKFVQIDPRLWEADADVIVDVALGQGSPEERLASLAAIAEKQEMLLQMGVPFVSMVEYRATLAKMAELAGFRHPSMFFKPWGEQEQMQFAQMQAAQPPEPDPSQQLVQIEQMKLQLEMMESQAKLALEERKMILEDDRVREKIAREALLKQEEIEVKHAAQVEDSRLRAAVARERAQMDADVKREQATQLSPNTPTPTQDS